MNQIKLVLLFVSLLVIFLSFSHARKIRASAAEQELLKNLKQQSFTRQFIEKQNTKWIPWKDLQFKAGDVIFCRVNFYAASALLATSNSDIISLVPSFNVGYGTVIEESWNKFHERETKKSNCIVKYTVPNPEAAIERAREWVFKTEYYNVFTCNCEHWVSYWVTGEAVSTQIPMKAADQKCRSIFTANRLYK